MKILDKFTSSQENQRKNDLSNLKQYSSLIVLHSKVAEFK